MLLRLITLLNLQHLVDNDATPAQPPGSLGAGGCGQRKQGSKLRGVSKEVSHLVQKQEKWCVSTFANAGQEWNTQSSLPSGGAGAAVLTLGLIQPGCAAAEQGPHKALGVPSTPKQHNGALPNPPPPGSTSVVALGSRTLLTGSSTQVFRERWEPSQPALYQPLHFQLGQHEASEIP